MYLFGRGKRSKYIVPSFFPVALSSTSTFFTSGCQRSVAPAVTSLNSMPYSVEATLSSPLNVGSAGKSNT